MRYTVNLDCKTHHVGKNGDFPILLRVSINGVHDYLNTGLRIKESQYDKKSKQVKSQVNGSAKLISFIDRQKVIVDASKVRKLFGRIEFFIPHSCQFTVINSDQKIFNSFKSFGYVFKWIERLPGVCIERFHYLNKILIKVLRYLLHSKKSGRCRC